MSIEKNIKKSLENFEMPYDNSAWESFSKKLDQHFPIENKKNNKYNFKTYFAAAALLSVIVTFLVLNNSNGKKDDLSIHHAIQSEKNNFESTDEVIEKSVSIIKTDQVLDQVENKDQKEKLINKIESENRVLADKNDKIINQINIPNKVATNVDGNKLKQLTPKLNFPIINDICQFEKIKIENNNNESIILLNPSNKQIVIESNRSINYLPQIDGEYQLGYLLNDKFMKGSSFNVKQNSEVEIIIDNENSFNEKGLPSTIFKTNSNGIEYNWFVENNKLIDNSKEVEAHLFKKGNYTILLEVSRANGCKSKESKNIKISKDYNLLAVDAFEPSSSNSKINSFIPYALTKRNVHFTMTIFDLNGNEVFKTNDANEPWNGFDSKTNEIAKSTSMYVWKVIIENPEQGEKSNYTGTIVIK